MLLLLLGCATASLPLGPASTLLSGGAPDPVLHHARVAADGSADFTTIGAALAVAEDGDTILVAPGTYREQIDFGGRTVRIESTGGPEVTTLDAERGGANIVATNGENAGTAVVGFTLANGRDDQGAAAHVELAALHLEDILVEGARGAVLMDASSGDLELVDVDFTDNDVTARGSVIYADRGAVTADGVRFDCGAASYGFHFSHGSGFIDNSEVGCAGAYAEVWTHSTGNSFRSRLEGSISIEAEVDHYTDAVRLENDVILGGVASAYGTLVVRNSVIRGGSVTLSQTYTDTVIENSVIQEAACAFSSDSVAFTFRYNDVWDVGATSCEGDERVGLDGNLNVNPQFTDADAGDYTLRGASPLIDAGTDDPAQADLDGTRNDIGVYGGKRTIAGGY